ncbi:hypothetical protein [Natronobeatus ordinarius]|uniref:hypothetical protein n=1 Tax=Natronobeatus ordinarius TaxID=2963433 RepID=UPI0020CD8636|nr:hypothetical protein [Natronobeatus ordinarius]
MTEDTTRNREPMKAISHANPYTGETLGQVFSRGPIVAADGGHDPSRSNAQSAGTTAADDPRPTRTMKDVSHTPPHDADDANRVFERGPVAEDE